MLHVYTNMVVCSNDIDQKRTGKVDFNILMLLKNQISKHPKCTYLSNLYIHMYTIHFRNIAQK